MDEVLRRLTARLLTRIAPLMDDLEAGTFMPSQWADRFAHELVRGHTAAMLAGLGNRPLDATARRYLNEHVGVQLQFLNNFKTVIESAEQFNPGWRARAALYAGSIGAPYWKGKVKLLPLPAMPKDGTTACLSNCGCEWQIDTLEGDGNYDCFWKRGKDDSCSTCIARARLWAPYKIRNGEVAM